MSTRLQELNVQRHEATARIASILATASGENRKPLTDSEQKEIVLLRAKLDDLTPAIERIESMNTLGAQFKANPGAFLGGAENEKQRPYNPSQKTPDPRMAERLMEDLSAFYRGQEITATDTPLIIGSGGLSGAVPTLVLDSLRTYFQLDSFALAGATVYPSEDTNPLVKPIVSAGVAPDAFSETQSATDSHPMQVDTFTFHGQKYSRLVKASEEALMNSALNLPGEITGELTAAVANAFTAVITTAMEAAFHSNSATYVNSGIADPYYSVLALINAVPPRFDGPGTCFMGTRAMRLIISNARAVDSGLPLLNPVDGTVLGRRFIVNDNCTRLAYGSFKDGCFIRKSPFFLQVLLELYSAAGERGFKATQFVDQHFLAEKTGVATQPLFYTHLSPSGVDLGS